MYRFVNYAVDIFNILRNYTYIFLKYYFRFSIKSFIALQF